MMTLKVTVLTTTSEKVPTLEMDGNQVDSHLQPLKGEFKF